MKGYERIQRFLVKWGITPRETTPLAENFSCPACKKFSFFCNGDFRRQSATIWRESVVGFEPREDISVGRGTAVLRCQFCGKEFQFPLSAEVIEAYALECPLWPAPKASS